VERQFFRFADVVILEIFGHEETARHITVEMAKQPVRFCYHLNLNWELSKNDRHLRLLNKVVLAVEYSRSWSSGQQQL
jgi:hypothetical protein